ncbi:MAG TPA: OB-fold domain-containing protein [Candidatus Binataceae bacterium]|nr:OB-fold domain-containing protein [Candidatus Binataceae bacterium]
MSDYVKPLPKPSPVSRPFWEAARRHELKLQRCTGCKAFIYYPRDRCPNCFSDNLEWQPVSGRGKVYSYTVVRRASARSFGDGPYVLAIIQLDEGPRMTSNVVAPPDQVRVDMPVVVHFDDVTPDHTLVKFKPA